MREGGESMCVCTYGYTYTWLRHVNRDKEQKQSSQGNLLRRTLGTFALAPKSRFVACRQRANPDVVNYMQGEGPLYKKN